MASIDPDRDRYLNEVGVPDEMPTAKQGRYPVIVRVVDKQYGVEYRAAQAYRWTATQVFIGIEEKNPDTGYPREKPAWLPVEDVWRVLRPQDLERLAVKDVRRL